MSVRKPVRHSQGLAWPGTGSKKICPENDCDPHVSTVETDHPCPARAILRVPPSIGERTAQRDTSKKNRRDETNENTS